MKIIKTEKYAGINERGKRDGTGPYKGSLQRELSDEGKRQEDGEKCPRCGGKLDNDNSFGRGRAGGRRNRGRTCRRCIASDAGNTEQ